MGSERKLSKMEEAEEVYGPKEPPSGRKSEERSRASRQADSRSRPRKKSEERISKSDHRSSSSKGIKEKEHSSKKGERYVQKQEDNQGEEDANAEKMEDGDNSQEDSAPILNALQMLQFGLKLNRKAETAVSEEPENSTEAPIKDKKAKKKEKKEKEKKQRRTE